MKKVKILSSMYTKFIAFFLGAFILSMLAAALFAYFTQFDNIRSYVRKTIEYRANNIRALVKEQGIPVEDACRYLTTTDVNIYTKETLQNSDITFSQKEIGKMKNGGTIIRMQPNSETHVLAVLELQGEYIYITPDLKNNAISQFMMLQRTTFFVPLFFGSILIILAVTKVVKPIKELSRASKAVADGNFNVEVKVRGKDEVADLSRNFNLMVKELSTNEYLHKDFVSNVSHEFKTPITSLMGYAKLLKKEDLTSEERAEYADIIIYESQRLSKLSSSLLRLSQLENEVIRQNKNEFSLSEQIRDSILLLQNDWEKKNLELDLNLEEVDFIGDKELMYQVWVNLISNAIKYSKDNGYLKVNVKKTDKITVEIIDNGIGMSKDEQVKIFLRFYKADKSRNNEGTGLGLSITKKIVELHHGTIQVESEVDKGSKFTVTLSPPVG
ncbi:HAMP domain-containing sensor histidine kinase [Clostridium sp.]|uniref:HAMP domain-containing sensor histidine kinase n=1 Tax=Clostridium sp. TaxID=1506 RepID=UPI002FCAA4EA